MTNNKCLRYNFNYTLNEYCNNIVIYPLDYKEIVDSSNNYIVKNSEYIYIDKQFFKYLKNYRRIKFHYSFKQFDSISVFFSMKDVSQRLSEAREGLCEG